MDRYGITAEPETTFRYVNYKYENLTEALTYARIDSDRGFPGKASPKLTLKP